MSIQLFGNEQPGMLEMGVEAVAFATPAAVMKFIWSNDNPGGLEALHRYMMDDESLRQTLHDRVKIAGYENPGGYHTLAPGASITTRHYLGGFDGNIPGAADYPAAAHATTGFPLIWLLEAILGGKYTADNDPVQAVGVGSTDTDIKVADSSKYSVGEMITVNVSAVADGIKWESGFIKQIVDGTTIKLRSALSAAPLADDPVGPPIVERAVYGSNTCYDRSYLSDSYTLRWTGHKVGADTPLRVTLLGCVPASATITLETFGLPVLEVSWLVAAAGWEDASAVGATPQTWDYPQPEQVVGQRFVGGNAAVTFLSSSATIEIDNGLYQIMTPGAEFGVYTCIKTAQTVTAAVRIPYSSFNRGLFAEQSQFDFLSEIGTQPGKRVGLTLANSHVSEFSGPVSEGGVAYCDFTMRSLMYDDDTGDRDETEPRNKSVAVAFG